MLMLQWTVREIVLVFIDLHRTFSSIHFNSIRFSVDWIMFEVQSRCSRRYNFYPLSLSLSSRLVFCTVRFLLKWSKGFVNSSTKRHGNVAAMALHFKPWTVHTWHWSRSWCAAKVSNPTDAIETWVLGSVWLGMSPHLKRTAYASDSDLVCPKSWRPWVRMIPLPSVSMMIPIRLSSPWSRRVSDFLSNASTDVNRSFALQIKINSPITNYA